MKNDGKSEAASGGIGFCGVLAILFIALKLLGHIGWSWWWVLSPLWMPLALVIGVLVIIFLVILICALVLDYRERRQRRARVVQSRQVN